MPTLLHQRVIQFIKISMKFISLKYHFQLRDNAAHVHTHKSAESIRVRYVVNLNA